jgi:hypothetical protein
VLGQHDDGNFESVRIALERARGGAPIEYGHVEIHENQIGPMHPRGYHSLMSIGDRNHFKSLALQTPYQHVTAELVVFG